MSRPCSCSRFQIQQKLLTLQPSGIAGEAPVRPQHPMAGDQDGDGVVSHCAAYRPGSGRGKPQLPGERTVCGSSTIGDCPAASPIPGVETGFLPDLKAEGEEGDLLLQNTPSAMPGPAGAPDHPDFPGWVLEPCGHNIFGPPAKVRLQRCRLRSAARLRPERGSSCSWSRQTTPFTQVVYQWEGGLARAGKT